MATLNAPSRGRRIRTRIGSVFFALLLTAGVGLWLLANYTPGGADAPAAEPEIVEAPEPPAILEVGVLKSQSGDLLLNLLLRGHTEASRRVDVRAETGGLVTSNSVPKGSTVNAGDSLCRIAPGERPALLDQAEARVAQAEVDAHSARSLAKQGFGSETAAAAAETALATAKAEVQRIRLDIQRTRIAAPFEGVLESDSTQTGALLQPGALCATILDLDPVHVVGFASERSINAFSVGMPASAELSTGQVIKGTISFVSRSAERRTRTFRVELTAENPDYAVRDGLGAEVLIPVLRPGAHLVPQSALTLGSDGRLGLRIVSGNRAQFAPVEVLRDGASGVWVAGLPETVEIIVVGQEFAADGTEVIARPAPGFLSQ